MRQILKSAALVIATLYFVVDAIFLKIARPIAAWFGRQKVLVQLRKWITSLGSYPSLALFIIPIAVLEPIKPFAAYLIGTGHIAVGITTLVAGELLKLVVVERLFKLCRRKLLKIPIFAWSYGHWRQGVDWFVSTEAWQAARRLIQKVRQKFKSLSRPSTKRLP